LEIEEKSRIKSFEEINGERYNDFERKSILKNKINVTIIPPSKPYNPPDRILGIEEFVKKIIFVFSIKPLTGEPMNNARKKFQ
jgi:hypothetical protein